MEVWLIHPVWLELSLGQCELQQMGGLCQLQWVEKQNKQYIFPSDLLSLWIIPSFCLWCTPFWATLSGCSVPLSTTNSQWLHFLLSLHECIVSEETRTAGTVATTRYSKCTDKAVALAAEGRCDSLSCGNNSTTSYGSVIIRMSIKISGTYSKELIHHKYTQICYSEHIKYARNKSSIPSLLSSSLCSSSWLSAVFKRAICFCDDFYKPFWNILRAKKREINNSGESLLWAMPCIHDCFSFLLQK